MPIVSVHTGGQVQIPAEWLAKWGHPSLLILEETNAGILIRPYLEPNWETVFAQKLKPFSAEPQDKEVSIERSDLLF